MKNGFKYLFFFTITFIFSYNLLELYEFGDQVHYRKFYLNINEVSFVEAFIMAALYIDSFEPVYVFIMWIGSIFEIPKDLYISFFNALLAISLIKLCELYKVKWFIILLLLSNFYLLVLFTGAERLKFAYLIIIISFIYNKKYIKNLFYISPLAHLQSTIFIAPKIISLLYETNFKKISNILRNIIIVCFFIGLFYFLKDGLIGKFINYYNASWDISQTFQLFILFLVYILITKKLKSSFLIFIPLFFLAIIIGGERVNMIGFTFVTFLLMKSNKLHHPLYVALLVYFVFKSISFLSNILNYGDGFI